MSNFDFYSRDHSMATELATALWYAIIANTDLLCYLLVFINMVRIWFSFVYYVNVLPCFSFSGS